MNDIKKLKRLAAMSSEGWSAETKKKVEKAYKASKVMTQSDMESWFDEWCRLHCNEVFERSDLYDGTVMYRLVDGCIFDRNHKDASVLIRSDGKICYNCFHDSCTGKHWQDFREYFEPMSTRNNDAWKRKEGDK